MARRLNIFTHLQQVQATEELNQRCPQPATTRWIVVARPRPKLVVQPKLTIAIGTPDRHARPWSVRIVLVA